VNNSSELNKHPRKTGSGWPLITWKGLHNNGTTGWNKIWATPHGKSSSSVSARFGPAVRSNPLGDLSRLQFSSSIEDYQDQFLILLAHCEGLREEHQIHLFTAGLPEPLKTDVELQQPPTLEDVMNLSRAFVRC
jgi:hypothetical protein